MHTFFAYLITYNFGHVIAYTYMLGLSIPRCLQMQLRSYQPPIPKTSQASAWSYKNIWRWMGKTTGSPLGLGDNFGRKNGWKITFAKVVDFAHLGTFPGPRTTDPDFALFHIKVKHGILNVPLHVCKNTNIRTNAIWSASLDKLMEPSKIT